MGLLDWLFDKQRPKASQRAVPVGSKQTASGIECAECGSLFEWLDAYWQEQSPGARNRLVGDTIPRAFCPHCGNLVCEADDRGTWLWVGRNETLNSAKSLPPSAFWFSSNDDPWLKRKIPAAAVVSYFKTGLDLSLVRPINSSASATSVEPADHEYVTKCLNSAFVEQPESRTWNSDPSFQPVLDALNSSRNKEAAGKAREVIAALPDLHYGYDWAATAYLRMDDYVHAREILNAGVVRAKKKHPLCRLLGEVEWHTRNLKGAVYWWGQAIHSIESIGDRSDESVYLFCSYLAEGANQAEVASFFLARADMIRPGQARLKPARAQDLRSLAREQTSNAVKSVLTGIRNRYLT